MKLLTGLVLAIGLLLAVPVDAAPAIPLPFDTLALVSADSPLNGQCFSVAYGLQELTGGERPTYERTGILFQARATCDDENLTPAEPWHSATFAEQPTNLTYLDYPELILLFWEDRSGGSGRVYWSYAWREDETGYDIITGVVAPQYHATKWPLVWKGNAGIRLQLTVVGEENYPRLFELASPPTSWREIPWPGIPTKLYLPMLERRVP